MNSRLIKIGNSKGVLLPKSFIEHANLQSEVRIDLTEEGVLIKPIRSSKRKKWEAKFRKETRRKPALELGGFGNDFDKNEWEWK
ncbi:MAG: AbrB/MazE/SpoVT family DNA-binding domain-containing protein [Bacteroidetes bacterium]|nr:AbrB/MazE/SpoVT family DNA-binding domain-containing protein [Bacteroidota bacterium]